MAVTNGWGQGAVNNAIDWGKGEDNATNSWGKVYDASSSGDTNITGSGGTPAFVNTKSIELDGVDDSVDCGNDSSLQITGAMTISAWVKTTSNGATKAIVGKDSVGKASKRSYLFFMSSAGNSVGIGIYKSGTFTFTKGTTAVNTGDWFHVMGVNTGTDLKIYINGVLENTNSGGGGTIDNGSDILQLGRRNGSNVAQRAFWNGKIDEVAIWNSDQSTNISTIYNSGVPSDLSSLSPVSWWRCGDGDTSPSLTDNGSADNTGAMMNFTTFSTDVPS